ncbi:MAG: Ppx/GppA phosphatase family protein [Azospirillaceae bacterium]|nr:Ppx/GppA phosphatase family protein [Azospirillaceae bacterium]
MQLVIERSESARGRRPDPPPVFAAIDLGTNNCRLLVARPSAGSFRVIDAFSRIVRLGQGLSRSRTLEPAAMDRALGALRLCSAKMARRGVTHGRAVATEACRRATNGAEFVDRARNEAGIEIETISSEEEARLALAGCAPLLDPGVDRALVFDIGGGSTEIMWLALENGLRPRILDQISLPLGVVGLTETYGGDRISLSDFDTMIADISDALAVFEYRNQIRVQVARGRVQMLGTSGTVTTLAGIHLGLPRYERARIDGAYLMVDHARAVTRRLLALDFEGRAAYACIGRDRADLVVAGCAVLEAICDTWPVERLRIADRGLREGILLDLINAGPGA